MKTNELFVLAIAAACLLLSCKQDGTIPGTDPASPSATNTAATAACDDLRAALDRKENEAARYEASLEGWKQQRGSGGGAFDRRSNIRDYTNLLLQAKSEARVLGQRYRSECGSARSAMPPR